MILVIVPRTGNTAVGPIQTIIPNMLFMAFSYLAARARLEYYLRMVTCVVRPEQLDELTRVLSRENVVVGMTVTNVRGFGRQGGYLNPGATLDRKIQFQLKLKLEILVRRKEVDRLVDTIVRTLRTGVGDGKIVVYDAAMAMRVRTGEKGRDAL